MAMPPQSVAEGWWCKPSPWVDLGLTIPVFVVYHLGVVFLDIRNGSDWVTAQFLAFAEGDLRSYLLLTSAIGLLFVGVFALLGQGKILHGATFVQIALEACVYAVCMRVGASYLVGKLFAGALEDLSSPWVGIVMSCGAGFYEELTYRALLFGGGLWGVRLLFSRPVDMGKRVLPLWMACAWSLFAAVCFSGAHYLGPLADTFVWQTFVFRALLGLVLTCIYAARGFAAAVWSHTLYDIGVLVF